MGKNQVPKTTAKKPPKPEANITKSKTAITNKNKNRTKPPTSNSPINGVKAENHNEEQVKAVSKKNKPSIIKKEEKNQEKKVKENDNDEKGDDSKNENLLYNFPMTRISRIIKAESDARINQEAIFLINKASEKFIQLFGTEAFEGSFLDKKKHISYQHLSSVVCKRKRLDFLSDYVPEKVKVEDALKETPSVET